MAESNISIEYTQLLNGQIVHLDSNYDDIYQSKSLFPTFNSYYFIYSYDRKEYEFYCTHWPPIEHSEREDDRKPPK